ncbi:MAG: hypothetical protein DME77_00865 [Verrucomicrobia bacterium]|nr:MAG: hypothetical protein DME77_00865 [Verrucomicrobiota bacterium]
MKTSEPIGKAKRIFCGDCRLPFRSILLSSTFRVSPIVIRCWMLGACRAVALRRWVRRSTFFVDMTEAIFFDAVGTLFYLTKTVGDHYALVGREVGLTLDAQQLDRAFFTAWRRMPPRAAIDGPRENDDKGWWRELVDLVLDEVAPSLGELDRDNFFEVAYEHFAEAGVWELYPEVSDVLEKLQPRYELAVISNFDGRLRFILEQLGISKFFAHIFISSEIGADKPDPEIYRRALKFMNLKPDQVLYVGDDPDRDWKAAAATGLSVFELDREKNSLRDLLRIV